MRASLFRILAVAVPLAAVMPLLAHHEFAAEFDDKKPVNLRGTISKVEWNDPHVLIDVDVKDANALTTWTVEFASRSELKKAGWTRDTFKVGDQVTVDASAARDGSKTAGGKSITVAGGKKLMEPKVDVVTPAPRNQIAKATPRWPDGHPRLGPEPGQKGYWANASVGGLYETSAGNIRMDGDGLLANIADAGKVAPFQPWAKGLYEYRQHELLKDDPMVSCLPPGGPRQFMASRGVQLLEQPDRQRIFVLSGGGNRNWRLIYLDGRELPTSDDVSPTYFGYSTAKWEGDTLVIHANAFNERFWFTNGGLPHTENLKLTERISRPDYNTLKYEVTVDDTGAYTRPWTGGWTLQWVPNEDMEQYFCQDNPKDAVHLLGNIAK